MSLQSIEHAYNAANIVYKNVGPVYDKWWMKEGYGQNYAWVMCEHSDYSVRLFFEFMDTGFCYVKVHFTNGASYEDLIATSWKFENDEYPFMETRNHVQNFLDNFFEEGGGMDMLRAKYEKGNNMYDVDSYTERDGYVKNSRKPVKSARERKYDYYKVLQGNYGYGWDDLVSYNTSDPQQMKELRDDYKSYQENEHIPLRIITRKELRESVKSSHRPVKSENKYGADVDRIYEKQLNRIKKLRTKGYSDDEIDDDEIVRQTKEDMRNVGKVESSRRPIKSSADNELDRELGGYFGQENIKRFHDLTAGAELYFDGWRIYIRYPDSMAEYYIKSDNGMYELHRVNHQGWDESIAKVSHGRGPKYFMDILKQYLPYTQERRDVEDPLNNYGNKLNQSFVVGKQINNSKSYLCEDGTYHSENEMCRPSIKIFNSKSEAEKIAKRSKSGFAQEL